MTRAGLQSGGYRVESERLDDVICWIDEAAQVSRAAWNRLSGPRHNLGCSEPGARAFFRSVLLGSTSLTAGVMEARAAAQVVMMHDALRRIRSATT